jgi:hypothetical protein
MKKYAEAFLILLAASFILPEGALAREEAKDGKLKSICYFDTETVFVQMPEYQDYLGAKDEAREQIRKNVDPLVEEANGYAERIQSIKGKNPADPSLNALKERYASLVELINSNRVTIGSILEDRQGEIRGKAQEKMKKACETVRARLNVDGIAVWPAGFFALNPSVDVTDMVKTAVLNESASAARVTAR